MEGVVSQHGNVLVSPKALCGMAAPFSSQDKAIPRNPLWVSWERALQMPSWGVQCAVTRYSGVARGWSMAPHPFLLPWTGFSASGGAGLKPLLE